MALPEKLIKSYGEIMPGIVPDLRSRPGLILGVADNGNHYLHLDIIEGDILVFDFDKPYEEGKPPCFVDVSTDKVTMLEEKKNGYEYVGKLVATVRKFD